jgi:hypothetical protein
MDFGFEPNKTFGREPRIGQPSTSNPPIIQCTSSITTFEPKPCNALKVYGMIFMATIGIASVVFTVQLICVGVDEPTRLVQLTRLHESGVHIIIGRDNHKLASILTCLAFDGFIEFKVSCALS